MKPTYVLHKLLKGFIVTSDEQVEKGNIVLETLIDGKKELFEIHTLNDIDLERQVKIIAQQDQIDFSGLSEDEQKEIGWFDFERLALKPAIEDSKTYTDVNTYDFRRGFEKGFKKVQELLSNRRFSLEDMEAIFYVGVQLGINQELHTQQHKPLQDEDKVFNRTVQSLSQKSWKIELEMEDKIALDGHTVIGKEPKLTNGKIKILKLCQNNLV